LNKLLQFFKRPSLQLKLSLILLVPIGVLLIISGFVGYAQERERALASMSLLASQTGQVIEHALEEDMANSNFDRVQSTIDTIAEDERVRLVYLLDTNGRVVFAPQGESVGQILDPQEEACQPCHSLPPNERPLGIVTRESDGRRFFRSMHPIENQEKCLPCHDASQRLNGVLLTDLSIAPVEAALTSDLRKNLFWWSGTIIAMIGIVNLGVRKLLVRRVEELNNAVSGFNPGENRIELPESPKDELGSLSESFQSLMKRVDRRDAENRRLSDTLKQRNLEQKILLRNLIHAQEEERKRVARELHDELGQALSSSALQIEAAKQLLESDPDQAEESLRDARKIIAASTEQISNLIMGLRPSVLDDLGLQSALRAHADRVLGNAGIDYSLDLGSLQGRVPDELETVLFRVFQEALTNIVRHSEATRVDMELVQTNGMILGRIADNGQGFNPKLDTDEPDQAERFGLLGMRERIELCGGTIVIRSTPGEGTSIQIQIPNQDCYD
jgi:signal transduction histidine kinase